MKLFITISTFVFSLWCPGKLYSQVYFQKAYDIAYEAGVVDGIIASDGGYVMAGKKFNCMVCDYDMFIMKTDSAGNLLWTTTFEELMTQDLFQVIETFDGGYVLAGETEVIPGVYDMVLVKTDANGNPLWHETYDAGSNETTCAVIQTPDSGLIVGGMMFDNFGVREAGVIKTNSTGVVQWAKTYGGPGEDDLLAMVSDDVNGFVMLCRSLSFGSPLYDLMLIKADTAGNFLWSTSFGTTGHDHAFEIIKTLDNGYAFTGWKYSGIGSNEEPFLGKTDSIGTLQWFRAYDHHVSFGLCQTIDSGFVMTGNDELDKLALVKTNASGDPLWKRDFGYWSAGRSVKVVDDETLIVMGSHLIGFGIKGYLIKTDAFGLAHCMDSSLTPTSNIITTQSIPHVLSQDNKAILSTPAFPVILHGGSEILICISTGVDENNINSISLFPNPANDFIIVRSAETRGKLTVKIFTITGTEIYSGEMTGNEVTIETSSFNDGIYVVYIFNNQECIAQKLVINHNTLK